MGQGRREPLKRGGKRVDLVAVEWSWRSKLDGAGGFAEERYRKNLNAWRRSVRPKLVLAFVPALAVFGALALIWPAGRTFYAGAAVGVVGTMYLSLLDAPPDWIAKWGRGAEGERKTARKLRRLRRSGWVAAHDVERSSGRGNHDHVVAGPGGVFLLETKCWQGLACIEAGELVVRYAEDDLDVWHQPKLSESMRRQAAGLQDRLRTAGVKWVQPVVVLWGAFPERVREHEGVTYVHGDELVGWLMSKASPARAAKPEHVAAVAGLPSHVAGRPRGVSFGRGSA